MHKNAPNRFEAHHMQKVPFLREFAFFAVIPVGHTLKCSLYVKRLSHRNPMYLLKASI